MHEPVTAERYTEPQGVQLWVLLPRLSLLPSIPTRSYLDDRRRVGGHTASFTQGPAKVKITFLKITESDWRVGFEVTSDRQSPIQIVQFSNRIFSGVFQGVREFLEDSQPMRLVFASKSESLGELYGTYLKREDTSLVKMGYEMELVVRSDPFAEFALRKSMPSSWRN